MCSIVVCSEMVLIGIANNQVMFNSTSLQARLYTMKCNWFIGAKIVLPCHGPVGTTEFVHFM